MTGSDRRDFLKTIAAGFAALSFSHALSGCTRPRSRPNIVFILIDDLGWADIGCYGSAVNRTPHLDELARQGMRFTDAYAACPVCSPTRASIHSGQYPARLGVIDFIPGHWRPYEKLRVPVNRTQYLPLEIPTLAEGLRAAGYRTAHFGKWHLGGGEHGPEHQGFDMTTPPRQPAGTGSGPRSVEEWLSSFDITDDNPKDVDRLTDLAVDFIEKSRGIPFFLYLSHRTVHIPLAAKPGTVAKYQDRPAGDAAVHPVYSAMVEEMDASVGRIMEALDELDLADDTVLVFFSDNGGLIQDYLKAGPIVTSNAPLRAEKGTLYEGGIREPLIVRWPGMTPPGSECRAPVCSVDLYPTFLNIAGAGLPAGHAIDGVDLRPLLRDASGRIGERPLFWHYPVYHHSTPAGAIREGDWKLLEFFEDGRLELYNLKEDIGEAHDLADEMPEKARELRARLAAWRQAVGAELPVANPDFDPGRRDEWGTNPGR